MADPGAPGQVRLDRQSLPPGLLLNPQGQLSCWWHGEDPLYQRYHDQEWGFPVRDDRLLFEKLSLESFQAGLSWLTILRKRENFRRAFCNFAINQVAAFSATDRRRLLQDAGIVRHKGKIDAVINNAGRAMRLREEHGSLAEYIWGFAPQRREGAVTYERLVANPVSAESKALSADLKKRGWAFVGPTTLYAFMQAMGLVNDHVDGCHVGEKIRSGS